MTYDDTSGHDVTSQRVIIDDDVTAGFTLLCPTMTADRAPADLTLPDVYWCPAPTDTADLH